MSYYLWEMRPYFRQVAGQLVLGSIAGFIMNTAVVLPAILPGQAIDAALAFERGAVGPGAVGWAALAFVGGTLLTEVPRAAKRWWLMTANARIRANIRADAWRGVIAWPMARLCVPAVRQRGRQSDGTTSSATQTRPAATGERRKRERTLSFLLSACAIAPR